MAIREYVGARYVPIFSNVNGGVWDNSYSYEPLTIVKYGTDFYTSRIPVPAGVAITNGDYWIKTGDYNGAISQLQDDIDELRESKTDDMSERVYLFLADSYETGGGDFCSKVGAHIGCSSYIIEAHAGSSFVRHSPDWDAYTYINMLTIEDPLTDEQLDSITDVVIFPSVNDAPTDSTDMYNAMKQLDTYLRNHMPKLKRIGMCSIGWAALDYTKQVKISQNLRYYSMYGPQLGWWYVDCTRVMRLCQWNNTSDGYHPTSTAGVHIADCCTMAILTGSCSWQSNPVASHYTISFPAAWGSPTITRPSDCTLYAQAMSNGDIVCRFSSDFLFSGVDLSTYNEYAIELTPTVAYNCPIPTYGEYYLGSPDSTYPQLAHVQGRDTGLRIRFIGGNTNITTKSVRIMNPSFIAAFPES